MNESVLRTMYKIGCSVFILRIFALRATKGARLVVTDLPGVVLFIKTIDCLYISGVTGTAP